jgi:hypothetical protein
MAATSKPITHPVFQLPRALLAVKGRSLAGGKEG